MTIGSSIQDGLKQAKSDLDLMIRSTEDDRKLNPPTSASTANRQSSFIESCKKKKAVIAQALSQLEGEDESCSLISDERR